jgi:YfiR/HmsC-like
MALLISSRIRSALLLGILFSGIGRAQAFNEYQVKAAFLYTFAKFVEWLPPASTSPSAAVTICVLGEDPFGNFLDDAIRGKTVGDRPLAVHRLTRLPVAHECQILFIAESERNRMPVLLASVTTDGLLTVGDTAEFAAQGGIIGLQLDGDRIRLRVNLIAAEKAKLRISSRLLSLATIVK